MTAIAKKTAMASAQAMATGEKRDNNNAGGQQIVVVVGGCVTSLATVGRNVLLVGFQSSVVAPPTNLAGVV